MRKKPTKEVVASRDPLAPPQRLAYRVDEACALLGVSRDTIERAVKDGRLRSSKRLGRRLIDARSIEALFDEPSEE
jgi:excisionase family DNA binding protein